MVVLPTLSANNGQKHLEHVVSLMQNLSSSPKLLNSILRYCTLMVLRYVSINNVQLNMISASQAINIISRYYTQIYSKVCTHVAPHAIIFIEYRWSKL